MKTYSFEEGDGEESNEDSLFLAIEEKSNEQFRNLKNMKNNEKECKDSITCKSGTESMDH